MGDETNTIFEKLGSHSTALSNLEKWKDRMTPRIDRTYYLSIINAFILTLLLGGSIVTVTDPGAIITAMNFIIKLLV